MGAQASLVKPLQAVLKARKLKVSERTLEAFLREVDRCAPWFAVSGSLSPPSWDKLFQDLQAAREKGSLGPGVMPIWKLIRACLEDERCKEAVIQGRKTLQSAQESLSETEREERIGTEQKKSAKLSMHSEELNAEKPSLYPLSELEKLKVDSSSSSSEASDSEEKHRQGRRSGPKRPREKEYNKKGDIRKSSEATSLTTPKSWAPLDPVAPAPSASTFAVPSPPTMDGGASNSFLSDATRLELQSMFPVLEQEGARVHRQVEAGLVKELAMAVNQYGPHANYTLSLLEHLGGQVLTPADWQFVIKAVLPNMGAYLNWKGLWQELLADTARANHQRAGEAGDTGGPLTAHGLAAAILKSNRRERNSTLIPCG